MHKVCNSWCMCVHLEVHEVCLEMPKVCTVCARDACGVPRVCMAFGYKMGKVCKTHTY